MNRSGLYSETDTDDLISKATAANEMTEHSEHSLLLLSEFAGQITLLY